MNLANLLGIKTAYADTFTPLKTFVGKVDRVIINPLIILMFAAALVYFLYGVIEFLTKLDNPNEREVGKNHMIWGVVGMFLMFAVFTILNIIQHTLGVSPLNPNIPQQ